MEHKLENPNRLLKREHQILIKTEQNIWVITKLNLRWKWWKKGLLVLLLVVSTKRKYSHLVHLLNYPRSRRLKSSEIALIVLKKKKSQLINLQLHNKPQITNIRFHVLSLSQIAVENQKFKMKMVRPSKSFMIPSSNATMTPNPIPIMNSSLNKFNKCCNDLLK